MRRLRYLPLPLLLVSLLTPAFALAAPWVEDKVFFTENASFSSSKVDAADLNGDGFIDLVFANGQGFDKGDDSSEEPQQAFLNDAGGKLTDASQGIFGGLSVVGRAVKLRDIDYDGDNDIVLGTTWQTQSQLLLNDGAGVFTNVTAENLPQGPASVGDLELGDVDGDGDLDIALSNWGNPGPGLSVAQSEGGVTLLWRQMGEPAMFGDEGTGMFEDVTLGQMPNTKVRWSWELEFVDVDNDWDLDLVVSAFAGDLFSVLLFTNEGGNFSAPVAGNVPQGKFGLDVEPMDLDGDSFMDLLSVHDGMSGRNRILLNDKTGKYTDKTNVAWDQLDNPASYDFTSAFYDYNSDGNVDFVLGAIQTAQDKYPDRLIYKMGTKFKSNKAALMETTPSAGTYSVVLADFDKDRRLDLAMAQKENATQKKVFIATEEIPVDTAAPLLPNYEKLPAIQYPGNETIRVRAHDNKSPLMLHDFRDEDGEQDGRPYLESWTEEPADPDQTPGAISAPGQWYGEYLWRINFEVPDADALWYRICAIDAAGNKACTPLEMTTIEGGTETESDSNSETMTDSITESESAASVTDSNTESESLSESDSVTVTESNSDSDSFTDTSTESQTESDSKNSEADSISDSTPTESDSQSGNTVPTESDSNSNSMTNSESDTIDSADQLDDDGCGCDTDSSPVGGVVSSLALLGLLGIRRRRTV